MKTSTTTDGQPTVTWVLEAKFKELTDDEIMDEWWHLTANGWEVEPDSQVQFARAILKKAQEK